MRTYVIEPQTLFLPFLTRVLAQAGLHVIATSEDLDLKDIAAHDPAAVFVDLDFFVRGAPYTLCRIRQVVRNAAIIAFCDADDATFEAMCYISGASAVLSKRSGIDFVLKSVRDLVPVTPEAVPLTL